MQLAKVNGAVWTRSHSVNGNETKEQMRYGTPANATHLVDWENNDGSQSGAYFITVEGEVGDQDLLGLIQSTYDAMAIAVAELGKPAELAASH